jgi:hypothetical protein
VLGSKSVSAPATITVVPDTTAPLVTGATADNTFVTVTVRFNELLDVATAEDDFNYSVTGPTSADVLDAVLQADGRTVVLTLSAALTPGSVYTVTVLAVKDVAGNSVAAGTTASVNAWGITPGFVTFQTYNTPVAGTAVSLLTSSPDYPNNPRFTTYIRSFDSRQAYPTDANEQYGGRMYGVFIPPTTGNWIFYLSSDDAGELYLNPTGVSALGKTLITSETACCNPFSSHASAPYPLTQGVPVYLEALWKEGGGGDYCRVAAKLESDPTNPDFLQPIPSSQMGTVVDTIGGNPTLAITNQPVNQVVSISAGALSVAVEEFTSGRGGFSVINGTEGGNVPGPTEQWIYNSATGVWAASGGEGVKNSALTSPPYFVKTAGAVSMTFSHRYNFEDDSASGGIRWDGGIVRVSVNAGAYTYVPVSALSGDTYKTDKTIGGNCPPVRGNFGFNGLSTDFASGAHVTTVVNLGTFNAGDIISVQFMGGWDEGFVATPAPNWEVSSVEFAPALELNNADGVATFSVGASATLSGQPVAAAFQWQKDSGAGFADILGANSATYAFLPTAYDDGARYRCVVSSPGAASVTSAAATLSVVPKQAITSVNGSVVVSWPAPSTGYALESATVLLTPATTVWSPVAQAPVVVDGRNTVTIPGPTAGNTFFRLDKRP